MSITIAMKRYFGYKQGDKLSDFAKEVRQLTQKDRIELAPLLSKELGEEVFV